MKNILRYFYLIIGVSLGFALFLVYAYDDQKVGYISTFSSPATDRTIIIDPGHGGLDPGAVSINGVREDELNLKVALKLKKYLEEQKANVIMTRISNDGLASRKSEDMKKRIRIIRDSDPDIVLSIHMNKFPQTQYFGAQTFYMKGSVEGEQLANCIQNHLVSNLIEGNNRETKQVDNLMILKASSVPSAIIECGFLSNPKEEGLLITDKYQEKIAWSIYSGVLEYFATQ